MSWKSWWSIRYSTFWWIPESGNLCQTTHMSQDSYTDYDPTSTNLKIYVSKQQQLCKSIYPFLSLSLSFSDKVPYERIDKAGSLFQELICFVNDQL